MLPTNGDQFKKKSVIFGTYFRYDFNFSPRPKIIVHTHSHTEANSAISSSFHSSKLKTYVEKKKKNNNECYYHNIRFNNDRVVRRARIKIIDDTRLLR